MAFTDAQTTLIFECLNIFEGGTFDWYDYSFSTGEIASTPLHSQIDFSEVKTRLETILTAIEAESSGREIRIGEILTKYDSLSLQEVEITVGGTNLRPGARYSVAKHKLMLCDLLRSKLGIAVLQTPVSGQQNTYNGFYGGMFR